MASDMGMGMAMDSGSSSGFVPLNDSGVDFSNETQTFNFLQRILDDSFLQVQANQYATYFWYGVVVAVAVAATCNVLWNAILRARLRAAAANKPNSARPANWFTNFVSTVTAVARETSYLQFTPQSVSSSFRVPPLGVIILVVAYFGFVLGLEFTNDNYAGAQHFQARSVRAAWLAVAQVPLLVLLSAKANLVGVLAGVSYERLNVYHRWVARGLLLLTSLHFGFESTGWARYGLVRLEWTTDTCPPTGIAAYAIVLWMNLSTLAPFRRLSYKLFVIQHILTFVGFIVAIMYHLPSTALHSRVYIWIAIGLYLLDRLVRTIHYLWSNVPPAQARFEALDGAAVKVRISSKGIKKWVPGAHVRLRFTRFGLWHTHPATVLSSPTSHNGDLVCILRARGGLTRQLLKYAEASSTSAVAPTHAVLVGGPYYSLHNDFAAFHTVVLIAGGCGITFTLSVLIDLAYRASRQKLPVEVVEFVWVVRRTRWVSWIQDEVQSACTALHDAGVEVQVNIFVTDEAVCERSEIALAHGPVNRTPADKASTTISEKFVGNDKSASSPFQPTASIHSGRPNAKDLLVRTIAAARGESAVVVCGPLGLLTAVRGAVVRISDERAVHKGTGAQGIYLHIANADYSS